jgi:type VI secretion system protein ImpF
MTRINPDQPLLPSVLDRLIDEHPEQERELPHSQNQVMSELRNSIRRDLENLLNTRADPGEIPAVFTELEDSLVNYGIPDMAALDLQNNRSRQRFFRTIERRIKFFEPRFLSVSVIPLENESYLDRTLRFRIEATMYAYPAPEPIVFDSELDPSDGQIAIKRMG